MPASQLLPTPVPVSWDSSNASMVLSHGCFMADCLTFGPANANDNVTLGAVALTGPGAAEVRAGVGGRGLLAAWGRVLCAVGAAAWGVIS